MRRNFGEIFADIRPSISRERAAERIHEKSSTSSTVHQIKFFIAATLGAGGPNGKGESEECQKPQPPLLLKKVSQYTSNLYCNTPLFCIAVLLVPLGCKERDILPVLLPLYHSTPPICIAIRLPFVSQYFWENPGGCGHRNVPQRTQLFPTAALDKSRFARSCQ